ncbi:uncharacterized protein LOC8085406 isoform X1 [Sorghum bicolor]|uniref:uncharacterized protein LOC8085406 isoform X1 n=1 Tax=Sorghum bicolor TaxID=4558 RepID=UPI000B424BCF|nr:uncharacterized protein LOC8085406 isoform X1 [Sorghum bicolor]|eukprot:XP_021311496.1 uncharacterized protein LOC8085406 isoform X1 [Sorghum bicolor]
MECSRGRRRWRWCGRSMLKLAGLCCFAVAIVICFCGVRSWACSASACRGRSTVLLRSEPWGRGRAAASCDNQVRIHLPLRLCYLLSYINCTPIRPLRDQTDLISCCRHGPAASSTSNPNPQRATEDTPTTPGSAMAGCTLQLPVVSSNRSTGTGTAMPARSAVRPSDSPSTPPGPMAF